MRAVRTELTEPDALDRAQSQKAMWQRVIHQAISDATAKSDHTASPEARSEADAWLREDSEDLRTVCGMAGIDPDFLRDAYVAGGIDAVSFHKNWSRVSHAKRSEPA